ncbi:MAG: LAGLIDADG endonuclease [Patescibacteria group bacterium]
MDNTVGSLTQLQKSFLIGTLLGDGYLRQIKGRRNAFLEVNHSINQKEYVEWKYKILKNLTRSGPKSRKGNGTRIAYRFFTRQHPEFTKIMDLFYRDKKKCIPDLILDPISLAVWYMDDGSRCSKNNVYLNTQQFSKNDQYKLLRILDQIGLKGTLNKDKQYYRIRFKTSSISKLFGMIKQHIIPSMKYKIGL